MSLDFAVLGQDGSPEKTVPLGVELHHELMTAATRLGLGRLREFQDYYEDAEVMASDLPGLAEQVATLRSQAHSADLRRFLDGLGGLIAHAMSSGTSLHAIAD